MKIFQAEDNPGDVRLLEEAFRECEANVILEVANDGEEAIEYLKLYTSDSRKALPNMILLDWNLPRKNGKEVLSYIRSFPLFQPIPVIVMSSSNTDTDIFSAYKMKANCYLIKPLDNENYTKMIRSITTFWDLYHQNDNDDYCLKV